MTTDPRQLARDLLASIPSDMREHGLTLDRDEDPDVEGDGSDVGLFFRSAPIACVLGSDNFSCLQEENEDGFDERALCDAEALALARLFAAAPILATALLAALDERDDLAEQLAAIRDWIDARTDAPRTDDSGQPLTLVQRLSATRAEFVRVRTERDRAKEAARVAKEAYANEYALRIARGLGKSAPADGIAMDACPFPPDSANAEAWLAGWTEAAVVAERDELRLTLAAEQGRAEGAPSEGWRWTHDAWNRDGAHLGRRPVRWANDVRKWCPPDWLLRLRGGAESIHSAARPAMIAADAALSGEATTSPSARAPQGSRTPR